MALAFWLQYEYIRSSTELLHIQLQSRSLPRSFYVVFPFSFSFLFSQMDLAERVVSLARGRYDDATALVVVFE